MGLLDEEEGDEEANRMMDLFWFCRVFICLILRHREDEGVKENDIDFCGMFLESENALHATNCSNIL